MNSRLVAILTVVVSLLAPVTVATAAGAPTTKLGGATTKLGEPNCGPFARFDPADFPARARVDNPWQPLRPGYRYTLTGHANPGGGVVSRRVVLTVTNLTKRIDGVTTVVAWDQDITGGELSEAELAFFAQDNAGNVWALGEYPEEYEDGYFTGAPSTWIAGVSGALAGLSMPADPRVGTPPYLEGKALRVEFYDCGQIRHRSGDRLEIDEWSPIDPEGGHQLKFYRRGVGNVRVGAVGDPEAETLALARVERLGVVDQLAADAAALRLERRAYKVSADYRTTPPARRPPPHAG